MGIYGLIGKGLGMASKALGIGGTVYGMTRSQKAPKEAHERAKEMQDRAHEQQLDMWNKTNYEAQVKHLEKAGLNPALLYGMSGAGGATTGAGNVASGAQEQVYDVGQNITQQRMAEAQIKLAEAQANKTEVEAKKIGGVDTEVATWEAELKKIAANIQGSTQQEQINQIKDIADKALSETVQERHKQIISEETYQARITQIKAESIGATLQNELLRSNKEVNEAKIKEIAEAILQRWEHIAVDREGQQTSRDNMEKLTNAMLWGAGINAAGNVVNNIVDIVAKPVGTVTKTISTDNKGRTSTSTMDRRNY